MRSFIWFEGSGSLKDEASDTRLFNRMGNDIENLMVPYHIYERSGPVLIVYYNILAKYNIT